MFHYLPYRYQAIVLNVLQVLLQSEIGLQTEVCTFAAPKKYIRVQSELLKQRFPGFYVQSFPTNTIPTT